MRFAYKRFTKDIIRPIIPITVSYLNNSLTYAVLVDSGADISVFDPQIARILGISLTSGKRQIASGITGASPIWNNITRMLLDEANPHRFPTPDGLVKVAVCVQTGTLTCQSCPTTQEALFLPGTEPTQACTPAYFQPKPSPQPGQPTNPNRDRILQGTETGQ